MTPKSEQRNCMTPTSKQHNCMTPTSEQRNCTTPTSKQRNCITPTSIKRNCMTSTSKQRNVLNNEAERIYVEKQHFVTQCSSFRMPVCGQYTTGQWRALQLEWLYRTKPEWPIMSGQLHIIILSQWNILHVQTVRCKQRRVSPSWFIYRHFASHIQWTASSNGDKHMWRLSSVSSLLNTQRFDILVYSRHQIKLKNYATLRSVPLPDKGHSLAEHINRKRCINLRNIKKTFIFVIQLTMLHEPAISVSIRYVPNDQKISFLLLVGREMFPFIGYGPHPASNRMGTTFLGE